ncbi:MAG: serine/threonine protein kinase [Deltaproteobacteria bacterium]|nr:MAG: serine/threonine protein kinase [Deltaproteobacteria bacterium]
MLEMGRQIDRYTLEAPIGAGGQGFVYRVRHIQLGTDHALKVVTGGGARMRERLLQEGRAQARLRHPNIVSVTDVVDVDGDSGLIMEFVEGPTLSALLAQERLGEEQLDLLAAGILEGVAHAHTQHFIHRDLKPDNVLCAITPRGLVPKIMDFGLVKALAGSELPTAGIRQTRSGAMMGTAHYMSPEQVRSSKDVDARTDVWALGVILYEMATGGLPFDGDDLFEIFAAVTKGEFTPVATHRPDLPERMCRAIEAALVVEVEQRAASVDALRDLWFEGASAPTGRSTVAWNQDFLAKFRRDSLTESEPSGQFETWIEPSIDQDAAALAVSTWDRTNPGLDDESHVARRLAPLVLAAGIGMGLVGVLALVVMVALVPRGTPVARTEPEPVAAGPLAEPPTPAPEPALAEPAPDAGPVVVEPVELEPAPEPVVPRPAPAPRPRPAPAPAPVPVVAPAPAPMPPPVTPKPKPSAPSLGRFTVAGDVQAGDKAYLVPADGGRYLYADARVPAGSYTVFFAVDGGTPTEIRAIDVATGQSVSANCDRGSAFCVVRLR